MGVGRKPRNSCFEVLSTGRCLVQNAPARKMSGTDAARIGYSRNGGSRGANNVASAQRTGGGLRAEALGMMDRVEPKCGPSELKGAGRRGAEEEVSTARSSSAAGRVKEKREGQEKGPFSLHDKEDGNWASSGGFSPAERQRHLHEGQSREDSAYQFQMEKKKIQEKHDVQRD